MRSDGMADVNMSNVFDQQMTGDQTNVLNSLKASFDAAYQAYRKMKALPDQPVVKAGFFAIAQFVVSHEPLADMAVQQALLEWIETQRFAAMKNEMQTVDFLIADSQREAAASRMQIP